MASPMFHPNLIPVSCRDEADVVALAKIMREVGLADIDYIDGYRGSDTVAGAVFKANILVQEEDKKKNILSSGHLRFIDYRGPVKEWRERLVNVVLTLMENAAGERTWNFSMSHANHSGPQRVDDGFATMLATAFLGEGYQEVEPKAVWQTIRHFVKECEIKG